MKLGDRDGAKLVFEIRLWRLSPARRTIYHFVYVLCSSGQPGAQRVSDLMIHTNEPFLWRLAPAGDSPRVFLSPDSSPELIIAEQQSFVTSAWEKLS